MVSNGIQKSYAVYIGINRYKGYNTIIYILFYAFLYTEKKTLLNTRSINNLNIGGFS